MNKIPIIGQRNNLKEIELHQKLQFVPKFQWEEDRDNTKVEQLSLMMTVTPLMMVKLTMKSKYLHSKGFKKREGKLS
jgi:hypothetical protein